MEAGSLIPRSQFDSGEWGEDHPHGTRLFVEQFFEYWNEHRPLLTARHMAIMSGDGRYQATANDAFRPVAEALQAKIEAGQQDGRIDDPLHLVRRSAPSSTS